LAPSFGIWAKRRKLWSTEKTIDSPEFFSTENKSKIHLLYKYLEQYFLSIFGTFFFLQE
jgi:hypothetical protein